MSKAPFLSASVPTHFFKNNSPCPACSFANIPSSTTYKMGFHRLVAEVKLISNLLGEAVSGGAGGLLVGGAGGCYLHPTSGSGKSWMPVAFKNGLFHPGVSRGASSLGRCGDGFSLPLGILERMLCFSWFPKAGSRWQQTSWGALRGGEKPLIKRTVPYLVACRPLKPFGT